jgi:hypothetical protein
MRNRRGWMTGIATAMLLVCAPAAAQRPDTSEDSVKAAFLYNFTKFVDWPASAFPQPSTPFVVCVFAESSFRKALEGLLHNEQVHGRTVNIAPAGVDDLRGCHLAYFGQIEPERQAKLLDAARRSPVLTVGEGRRFLEQGGLIAFMLENDRVRFAVSRRGADAAGLNVSSKLLRVARAFDGRMRP